MKALVLLMLVSCAQISVRHPASCESGCESTGPKHCKTYREGLAGIDVSNDPYLNRLSNAQVGHWECMKELSNVSIIEIQEANSVSLENEKMFCGGQVFESAHYKLRRDPDCFRAHLYSELIDYDLDSRQESPACHEYYRQRDQVKPLSDYELALFHQKCAREENEKSKIKFGSAGKLERNIDWGNSGTFLPSCGSMSTKDCVTHVKAVAAESGCTSVQYSCNEDRSYCLWGSDNCSVSLDFGKKADRDVVPTRPICLVNDTIVKIGSGESDASPIGGMLCRWK